VRRDGGYVAAGGLGSTTDARIAPPAYLPASHLVIPRRPRLLRNDRSDSAWRTSFESPRSARGSHRAGSLRPPHHRRRATHAPDRRGYGQIEHRLRDAAQGYAAARLFGADGESEKALRDGGRA